MLASGLAKSRFGAFLRGAERDDVGRGSAANFLFLLRESRPGVGQGLRELIERLLALVELFFCDEV